MYAFLTLLVFSGLFIVSAKAIKDIAVTCLIEGRQLFSEYCETKNDRLKEPVPRPRRSAGSIILLKV